MALSTASSSSSADGSSLKQAQLAAVHRMLAFQQDPGGEDGSNNNNSLPPAGSSHNQWKILIYDMHCRSIISPLLSVQQLRRRGVTLHLLLHADNREPIPDVPAIYFCQPTKENLARIASDCSKGLYARAHLNFVTKLERPVMEDFAKLMVQTVGSTEAIASLHDQYLDFVCMEKRLFSLHKASSYLTYNGSGTTEAMMEQAMTEIAQGLFSVVATCGHVPILRCPKGGAPEMVARKLNRMIAEHPTLLRRKSSMSRPLLVLLDRNSDLMTPIQHVSTYQSLIDDVLKHKANRVEFEVVQDPEAKRKKTVTKRFDLDPDQDAFYRAQKFHPFPEAIESNGAELQQVTAREQEIRSKAVGGGNQANQTTLHPQEGAAANDLAKAVDSLPALLDRKKQLEVHTSILQAVMNQVAARDVPQFYELESALATGTYRNDLATAKKDVLALVSDPNKAHLEDKVRLIFVYAVATGAKTADIDQVTAALEQAAAASPPDAEGSTPSTTNAAANKASLKTGLQALDYLKQLRAMHMIPSASDMLQELQVSQSDAGNGQNQNTHASNISSSTTAMWSSLMTKATSQATGLLAKATDKVTSMLGKIHKHHATVVVENLCDFKAGTEDETYLYLDPKVKGDVNVAKIVGMSRAPIREAIVFTIGGGCYGEYQNLQMLETDRRKIVYGSTELLNATEFLAQLGALGKQS